MFVPALSLALPSPFHQATKPDGTGAQFGGVSMGEGATICFVLASMILPLGLTLLLPITVCEKACVVASAANIQTAAIEIFPGENFVILFITSALGVKMSFNERTSIRVLLMPAEY